MYSVFKGEYVKEGFTLEKICEELNKRGYNTTVSHLSQILNGVYKLSFKMAKDLKDIIGSDFTLEELFEIKEAG